MCCSVSPVTRDRQAASVESRRGWAISSCGQPRPDDRHGGDHPGDDAGDEERGAERRSRSETGPASAIETGIRLIETKKSREATRPSMCGGTRRWSSVPQMTIGAENITPEDERCGDDHPDLGGQAHHDEGQAADAPEQVHPGQVAARHRQRGHRQRPDRPADAERGHHQGVVAGTATEAVLDQERDEHLERAPSSPGSSARRRSASPAATGSGACRRSPRGRRPAPRPPGGCRRVVGLLGAPRRPGRRRGDAVSRREAGHQAGERPAAATATAAPDETAPTTTPATAGPSAWPERGPDHALEAVDGLEVGPRRRARAATRSRPGSRRPCRRRSPSDDDREVPDLGHVGAGTSVATRAIAAQLEGGDAQQDALLRHPVGHDAAEEGGERARRRPPAVETTES